MKFPCVSVTAIGAPSINFQKYANSKGIGEVTEGTNTYSFDRYIPS